MDQETHDFDPLAPPPSSTQTQHDYDDSFDQTVPNLETGESRMDFDQSHHDSEPRNFHDDLPANFAREAAKHEEYSQNYYEQDSGFQPNQHHQDRHDGVEYGGEDGGYDQGYPPRSHDQLEYEQDPDEVDSQGGLADSGSSNPFGQSGDLSDSQKCEHDEGERRVLGGYNPFSGQEERQSQERRREEDEEISEGEDEYERKEEMRYESNAFSEHDQYGASPPEADRYRAEDEQNLMGSRDSQQFQEDSPSDGGATESQGQEFAPVGFESQERYVDSEEEDDDDDEEGVDLKMDPVHIQGHPREAADSDNDDQQAGTFEYNKMEEEETTEDNVSGTEAEDDAGKNLSGAAFDNHAFDDNDDEDAEVIERKIEKHDDIPEVESGMEVQPAPGAAYDDDSDYDQADSNRVEEPAFQEDRQEMMEHAPVEHTPVEHTPVEHTPVEHSPAFDDGDHRQLGEIASGEQPFTEEIEYEERDRLETAPLQDEHQGFEPEPVRSEGYGFDDTDRAAPFEQQQQQQQQQSAEFESQALASGAYASKELYGQFDEDDKENMEFQPEQSRQVVDNVDDNDKYDEDEDDEREVEMMEREEMVMEEERGVDTNTTHVSESHIDTHIDNEMIMAADSGMLSEQQQQAAVYGDEEAESSEDEGQTPLPATTTAAAAAAAAFGDAREDEDVEEEEQKPSVDLSTGGEEISSEAEKETADVYEGSDELRLAAAHYNNDDDDTTDLSSGQIEHTPASEPPSSFGGDFESTASAGKGMERSFADTLDDMASPETIPQRLPSPPPPKLDSMSQFDPLAPASASSSPSPDDEPDDDDLIINKSQQQQQQQQSSPHQGQDDLYYDNQVISDGREESSEDLCLHAGEIEGETKFGVDGSAITTSSADQNINNAFTASEEEEEEESLPNSNGMDLGFEQKERQELVHQQEGSLVQDYEDEDELKAGLATDYTTTTTTTETEPETDDKSGGDLDSSSIGQMGFEQGFEGSGAGNDNALMSMSMEGSFYDDGGDLMGGADGANADKDSNLLIQSAITEVSEPTSSFSPHQDSVLRAEQQAFEQKLAEQNGEQERAAAAAQQEEDFFDERSVEQDSSRVDEVEEQQVQVHTTHESFASIPSGFEEESRVESSMGDALSYDAPSVQEDDSYMDDNSRDADISSQAVVQNGGAVDAAGMDSLLDEPLSSAEPQIQEPAAPAESSSVDSFGIQGQCNLGGSGFEDSSSVDNSSGLVDNSSAVNGYHDDADISDIVGVKEPVAPVAEEPVAPKDEGVPTEAAIGVVAGAATVAAVAAAASSSSTDAAPAAGDKKEKKADDKAKKDTKKDKEKEKKPAGKTTTTTTATARKTATTTTGSSSATARKTTSTTSKSTSSTTTTATTRSARPTTTRPTSASAAKKSETSSTATPRTATSPRKPTSATAIGDKKSPTKAPTTSPSAASKPLPRYAQPITPRKPRDASASGTPDATKKPATPRTSTTPRTASTPKTPGTPGSTPRTRPASSTTRTTTTTSAASRTTTTPASTPRPKSSPTKLPNGTGPASTDKRSTSPMKKYGIGATRTPTNGAAKTTEKREVKTTTTTSTRTGATPTSAGARSPTKAATPRTPSNPATPRSGPGSATAKTPGKKDYSNVTSRIGSKDKMAHKPGGGNVKIESRKVKIEAKSKVGSLDNASHKPAGGDKKVENGADGSSPV